MVNKETTLFIVTSNYLYPDLLRDLIRFFSVLLRVRFCSRIADLVKAERRITLFQYSAADYTPRLIFQFIFVVVFDNQQAVCG